ncbi:uncharacterized protein LOC134197225 [Corticium candelabrum]|uniref:uncharacterized protein LOC134197225 n=1 Tax=Corticium candelabrum TaxID=121492 RepID=UPI002E26C747|nr:uncharacterized protein LOC134197225 [Corticium candelabrum]
MLAFTEEDTELHEQTVAAEEQEIDVIDLIQPTDKEMPLEKDFRSWSVKETAIWLRTVGCEEVVTACFIDEDIDGEALQLMTEESRLVEIGVKKMGARLRLIQITEVQEKSESAPMDFDCMSNFYGKLPKERQAFLKAHRPWLYNQYMHSKRFIRSEVRKHFPIHHICVGGRAREAGRLVKNLESKCSVPEIGFGLVGIRYHAIQTTREARRRQKEKARRPNGAEETTKSSLNDRLAHKTAVTAHNVDEHESSNDPEEDGQPAACSGETRHSRKRPADAALEEPPPRIFSCSSMGRGRRGERQSLDSLGIAPTDTSDLTATNDNHPGDELSQRDSNIIVAAVLKLPSVKDAVMGKLRLLARQLGVPRYSSKDKNWLVLELAWLAVQQGWVKNLGNKDVLSPENVSVTRYFE